MKFLDDSPDCGVASCFGCGESGLVEEAPAAPAPEGCCAQARAGTASAASHRDRQREEQSAVRSVIFDNIISPWMSAAEWNEVIGPGPRVFRLPPDSPRIQGNCQWMRFIPAKTKRRVCTMMRASRVLMRDFEAKYHGGPMSCNRFYRWGAFAAARGLCAS